MDVKVDDPFAAEAEEDLVAPSIMGRLAMSWVFFVIVVT